MLWGTMRLRLRACFNIIVFNVIKVSVEEQHRTKVQTELSQTGVRATPTQAVE